MVNSIIKHRRGHIDKWRRSNIVPEDGELIIVEFDDGSRKCKVGDGKQNFSKLKYVDDATRDELLNEFAKLTKEVDSKIKSASLKQSVELKYAKEEIAQQVVPVEVKLNKVSAELSDVNTSLNERLNQLDNQKASKAQSDELFNHVADIYDEIADLIDDDVMIINKVFAVENTLMDDMRTLKKSNYDDLQEISANIDALNEEADNIKLSIEAANIETTERVDKLEQEMVDILDELADNLDTANSKLELTDMKIATQNKRIADIMALRDGSTTGDAELIDARTVNDKRYDSVGDAIRAVGTDVASLRDSLSQYIDTQAIDGLHYDYSGDVGLKKPYMLYLTTGGEVVRDSGVQIISGAGGGGSVGGGGGSTVSTLLINKITQSPVICTSKSEVKINFIFSGTDPSGDPVSQADATCTVDGVIVDSKKVNAGDNFFDITKHIANYISENKGIKSKTFDVLIEVTDKYNGYQRSLWEVKLTDLYVESNFDDKRTKPANETVIFDYIPYGTVEKTVVIEMDGEDPVRIPLEASVAGSNVSYELPAKPHGDYLLAIHIEATIDGRFEKSDTVYKNIKYYDSSSKTPLVGIAFEDDTLNPTNVTLKQYSVTNIIYTVYDPANDTPTIRIEVDGQIVATPTVSRNPDYKDTPTSIYPFAAMDAGAHTIKIICGSVEKSINVFVESIGATIKPVTTGLAFDFNPVGKSNADIDRDCPWTHNGVRMEVSPGFDWINGGYIPDDPDGPCFCIKAGSEAIIDYKLFADEAKTSGKEVKIVFKTKNLSNPDAIFLSCLDNTTAADHIGFTMGAHAAHIYGKDGNLELVYSEGDTIELEFNISKDTEPVPMVMGYEDGVPSRPLVYSKTHSFKQNTPKVITLGSPDCDLYIYRFKAYKTSLSNADILDNFIADARTVDELLDRYKRNKIYDAVDNSKLTAESLAENCPWLRVYKVSAPYFTNHKDDKVPNTTIQQIYRNGDRVLDNWKAYNVQHSGQGTSSNDYGAAGRNLDFIMNKSGTDKEPYFVLGDGTIAENITLTRQSVPVAYLNAKVNIASSNNLTNALLARKYNQYNPYRRPFVRDDESLIDKIKDTMEFYNCAIFIQESDPNAEHREFADTDWHFYAIGNIGDSKKTDNTRLTDLNDPYECCVEIMDIDRDLAAFPRDTFIKASGTWVKDSNLGILYEKAADGSYVLTSDSTVDFDKTYYVEALEHDDFSELYTYGWRYISDKKNQEVVHACKQAWIEFYRFVTTTTDEEFKARLSEYFVVDSALYYYLFTTRYCMVDNRAKNTFWHYGKTADGTRKWDLCWDYDNDTALGLNNFGQQVYRYGLEDIDRSASGIEVFRVSNSLFFSRIRDLFDTELRQMYQTLESQGAWNAESFLKECDDWQAQFPEELWRVDIERKYIRTYNESFINEPGKTLFLTDMANGRMKYHRRQWERNQEAYMAAKYQTTAAMSDKAHAHFRVDVPEVDLAIQPKFEFTLTPYQYTYLNVQYGNGGRIHTVRVTDDNLNKPTPVPYETDSDIINVGSAASIRDFGDLSAFYLQTVDVGRASRIKTLKIGNSTPGYANPVLSSLDLGNTGADTSKTYPALLEQLDLTNVTGYSGSLDLRGFINLRKLFAFGTKTSSVIFAEGGKIEYAELPAINSLVLRNLNYFKELKLESYNNIVDLTIEGCPHIDQLSLFEACPNLTTVKLDNVNFGTKDYTYFIENVFTIKNASIAGTVHINSLTGAQFNAIKSRHPKLEITYNSLDSIIKFMDTDLSAVIYEQHITNAGDCVDITTMDSWVAPIKAADQEFTYEWFGWAETENTVVCYDELSAEDAVNAEQADYLEYRVNSIKHVEGDRTLYPVFKVKRNGYEVRFINPTDNNKVLYTVIVPYGKDAKYPGIEKDIKKLDGAADFYEFAGWLPSPANITGPRECYAQFTMLDNDNLWYSVVLADVDYTTDTSANALAIIYFNNRNIDEKKAIRIPNSFNVEGTNYSVVSIKGFDNYYPLEMLDLPASTTSILDNAFNGCTKLYSVKLPNNLKSIGKQAFYNCMRLADITLPDGLSKIDTQAFQDCRALTNLSLPASVTNIGDFAFRYCYGLTSIEVASGNTVYDVVSDCLIDTRTGTLLLGLATGVIPQDGTIKELAQCCFYGVNLASVKIPDSVTTIPLEAFHSCKQLTSVQLPESIKTLDHRCFMSCSNLKAIELPNSLRTILTYAFNGCSFTDLIIPASVEKIYDHAFGDMSQLVTVTFEANTDDNGNIIVPKIHANAFGRSYPKTKIIFRVPWAEGQVYTDPNGSTYTDEGWGAIDFEVIYNYRGG